MEKNSLPELVSLVKEIEQKEAAAEKAGENLPEELYYQKEILTQLVEGRIDRAVELKLALESHIEALKVALEKSGNALDTIEKAFKQTMEITKQNRIDGLAWHVRLQNNSRASMTIEDEAKLPDGAGDHNFRFCRVTINEKFPVKNTGDYRYWASVILRKPMNDEALAAISPEDKAILDSKITREISKTEIESYLKANEANKVEGVTYEKGRHVRFGKGEARPKAITGAQA